MKPLVIDLFCGLGGWTDGLLAEGYNATGYDIEEHVYGDMRYPAKLVLQDVLTLHGAQFKDAALIVAAPPCQEYSYMAMPWKLAKAKAAAIRADTTGEKLAALNRLFNACFRIQAEASLAAGRHIPMVVENVRGAQPWVGRARWNFGSFYLWGDVPALMPFAGRRAVMKDGVTHRSNGETNFHGYKVRSGRSFQSASVNEVGQKNTGGSWFAIGSPGQKVTGKNPVHELSGRKSQGQSGDRTAPGKGARFTSRDCGAERSHAVDDDSGTKIGGDLFSDPQSHCNMYSSKSNSRKMASAMIAKIPLVLSRHIGATYLP